MRVAMIGSGYVGLVSGACFADFGHQVTCVDKDGDKIARLRKGDMPIFEPDLDRLVVGNTREKRLDFSTDLSGPVGDADAVFIAVGTPSRRGDGHADLSYVYAAAAEIATALRGFTVVITKSTVPVGTGDDVERIIRETNPAADFAVVSNPEFLREGAAIQDFKHPDRIVVGTEDERARKVMAELYRPLYLNQAPILYTSRRTAELIKYAANAFLATKLSFVNAVATVCEQVGANVDDVLNGMGHDHRIGFEFLQPGPGWGGSCFPKDTAALVRIAADHGYDFGFLKGAIAANEAQFDHVADKIARLAGGSVAGRTIAVLGLTFKAGTDDRRDSPAVAIVDRLLAAGATVVAHDPAVDSHPGVTTTADPYDAARGADVLAILTEWPQFAELDYHKIGELMAHPCVVDGRNLLDPATMLKAGFSYEDLGRWTSAAGGGVAPILGGAKGKGKRRAA
jgi:UDPglucose 6-dehydrogenase